MQPRRDGGKIPQLMMGAFVFIFGRDRDSGFAGFSPVGCGTKSASLLSLSFFGEGSNALV